MITACKGVHEYETEIRVDDAEWVIIERCKTNFNENTRFHRFKNVNYYK